MIKNKKVARNNKVVKPATLPKLEVKELTTKETVKNQKATA